jgi:glycosyltransferase involved in cell wall biosynthesis
MLHRPQDTPRLAVQAAWELADHRALRRAFLEHRPDIIYCWCMLQLFPSLQRALRRAPAPVVINIQDVWLSGLWAASRHLAAAWSQPAQGPKRWFKGAVAHLLRTLDPHWGRPVGAAETPTENMVFCSDFRYRQHLRTGPPVARPVVIPNGVDPTLFLGHEERNASPTRTLFVGRLVEEKGAHVALAAMRRVEDRSPGRATLTIVGIPAYPLQYGERLRNLVKELSLGHVVTFSPPQPNHAMPDVYRRHDILLFTSTGDEGFPVAILEAMASRVAVIATATGGTPEILMDGQGLLVPPGDAEALANAISELAQDRERRDRLSRRAFAAVASRFTVGAVTAETLRYLGAIAARER